MSQEDAHATLLAARCALTKSNPGLLDWSTRVWENWLRKQRSPDTGSGRPVAAIVFLSCLEDLPTNVGLMQLLALPGLACSVVLAFPTNASASIARSQARREEWHELVRIATSTDLTRMTVHLPADAFLTAFAMPVLLDKQSLARVRALADPDGANPDCSLPATNDEKTFLGRAADFAAWYQRRPSAEVFRAGLKAMLAQDPERIASDRSTMSTPETLNPNQSGLTPTVREFEGGLDMPGLRNGGDLIVTAIRNSRECQVVVRHRGDLLDPDQALRVRMPTTLLTTVPQRIRAESRMIGGRTASREFLFHVPPGRLQPWMMSAFLNRGGGGNPVVRAFANGVGCRLAYAEDEPEELRDLPVVWGVLRQSDRILAQAKRQGLYFFYIDHAYFNRGHGKTYRITRNGYEAGPIRDCPGDRFSDLDVDVRPWRMSGRQIIVCPPTEYFMQAHGCPDWLDQTLASLRRFTDRPIAVRHKPQPGTQSVPLPEALKTAHALVAHSSNVAIEAACLGTPVFVDAASAAAPVGLTDLSQIEKPVCPDRDRWLAHLAYNQFSFEEIEDGRAWNLLRELEERPYV